MDNRGTRIGMKHASHMFYGLLAALLVCIALQACSECKEHSDCGQGERCLDGSCETAPPPCDSEPAPTCDHLLPEAECLALGGEWRSGVEACTCPTGDAGCPCWSQVHCQGKCLGASQGALCSGEHEIGECSALTTVFGCHCEVMEHDGVEGFTGVCID